MKKCISILAVIGLCLAAFSACAEINGEQEFWTEYLTECIGVPKTLHFTQQDAKAISMDMEYFGAEFISISYGSGGEGTIVLSGMENGTLTGNSWNELDEQTISSAVIRMVDNWGGSSFQKYRSEVAVVVQFSDGYSLMYNENAFPGGWILVGDDSQIQKTKLEDGEIRGIVSEHTGK